MIFFNIEQAYNFFHNREKIINVLDYLKDCMNPSSIPHKRIMSNQSPFFNKHELQNNCFALEQVFNTVERNACVFESHKNFIDFQFMISGKEQMEFILKSKVVEEKYDRKKDFIYYKNTNLASKLVLSDGDLVIFEPNDVHMGMPLFEKTMLCYKTVVKVPVDVYYEI